MPKIGQKPRNFYGLKKECELITKVALELRESNDNSSLINNVYGIRDALTQLQIVSRKYREVWKRGELKTYWYRAKKFNRAFYDTSFDKTMCFYQQFKDLSSKNYLVTIRVASRKLANKCMKSYRDTGAQCSKRYYSLFRALEKQIHRLDTTLGKKVSELVNGAEPVTIKYPRPPKKPKKPKKTREVEVWMGIKTTTIKLGDEVISVKKEKTGEPVWMWSRPEIEEYNKELRRKARLEKEWDERQREWEEKIRREYLKEKGLDHLI